MEKTPYQPVVVDVTEAPSSGACSRIYSAYKARQSLIVGSILIVSLAICFVLSSVAIAVMFNEFEYFDDDKNKYDQLSYGLFSVHHSLAGVWSFVFILPAGILAICAARKKSGCTIIGLLVMSVVATIFVMSVLGVAIGSLMADIDMKSKGFFYTIYNSRFDTETLKWIDLSEVKYSEKAETQNKGLMALSSLLLICSITNLVCCIWTIVISSQAVCCCQDAKEPTVMYNSPQTVGYSPAYTAGGQEKPEGSAAPPANIP